MDWAHFINDIPVVDFGAHRDEVAQQLVDGLPGAVVWQLEQLGVCFDDGLDQPLHFLCSGIDQLVAEDVGLLDDVEGVVRGTGAGVNLCSRVAGPQP